jgi:hypothetical protein
MRTTEERISLLQERARELARIREKRRLRASGGLSLFLFALLGGALYELQLPARGAPSGFAGSSLLGDDVGGYVLVAVLFFMTGVAVTAVIRRRIRKRENGPGDTRTGGHKSPKDQRSDNEIKSEGDIK